MPRRPGAFGTALMLSVLALVGPLAGPVHAGDGEFDTAFGDGGTASAVLDQCCSIRHALAATADAGFLSLTGGDGAKFYVVRWTSDGSLDESFGAGGIVAANYSDRALAIE